MNITANDIKNIKLKAGETYNPLKEFHSYVFGFYGEGGLYDYNFTHDEITHATIIRLQDDMEFCGDSVDREAIRDIVFKNRGQ